MNPVRASVDPPYDLAAWRLAARVALLAGVPPEAMTWISATGDSLINGVDVGTLPLNAQVKTVPASFLALAGAVLCHRDENRHALLYRLLWRITHGTPRLLAISTDEDVRRAHELAKAVRRDSHKMKAFVRFREISGGADNFVAWFEPEHWILDRVAPFFARRFAGMRWAILTPYRSVRWDGTTLEFGAGQTRADAPTSDSEETLWQTYYASIFNPARLNPRMMRQEMPQKYWGNLPEARLLPELIRSAGERTRAMVERAPVQVRRRVPAAAATVVTLQRDATLSTTRQEATFCRACELWQPATQTVFGEGPSDARIMLVGEQPGDQEDLAGRPFVGPAGKLLDRALAQAGIERGEVYLTNAVKHFRFERRGKARLHKNPGALHIKTCNVWLAREILLLKPRAIVCLGATASNAVLKRDVKLMQERGIWQPFADGVQMLLTVHPSWVLRQVGDGAREAAYQGLVRDLALLRAVASSR